MGSLLAYSGITTKVKAMKSHLITDDQFREMAALNTVTEAVEYLRQQPAYGDLFAGLEDTALHRGGIEERLSLSLYRDFAKLYRFSNLTQRKFLNLYFMHYEISILKRCLRHAIDHRQFDLDLSMFQDFFEKHSKLDLIKLSTSDSLTEFLTNLEGSVYYSALAHLSDSANSTLFDYEMHMDLLYFKTVWKVKGKYLSKAEQSTLLKCYGAKLDLLNIQWIYRSKKYYSLPSADIYALLIPVNYRLKKEDMIKMAEAANLEEFYAALQTNYYGLVKSADMADKPNLESMSENILNHIYALTSKNNPYSIASLNSYLYFKELEFHKITTTIECIRYGISVNEILSYVVKNK